MANFTDPLKVAFGRYLWRYFDEVLVGDTPAVAEFVGRPFKKAMVWAPGRMVDQVDEMLDAYRKNDTSQATQPKTALPIMIAAMSKDFVPAPPEYGRGLGDYVDVRIPGDSLKRLFRMRVALAEVRTQVAIIAADEPSARSMAMQLHLYASAIENRTFYSDYKLAGFDEKWSCQLEMPDLLAINSPTDVKNLTVLAVDITMRAAVPFLKAPRSDQPNDGQGSGNTDDPFAPEYNPNGYLTVIEVNGKEYPPVPGAPPTSEFTVDLNTP